MRYTLGYLQKKFQPDRTKFKDGFPCHNGKIVSSYLVRKAGLKNFFLKYVSHNFQLSTFYQNFRSIRRVLLGFLIGSKKRGRVPLNKIENEMNRRDKNRKYYYFFNYFIGFVKLMMEIKYAIFFFKRYAASM